MNLDHETMVVRAKHRLRKKRKDLISKAMFYILANIIIGFFCGFFFDLQYAVSFLIGSIIGTVTMEWFLGWTRKKAEIANIEEDIIDVGEDIQIYRKRMVLQEDLERASARLSKKFEELHAIEKMSSFSFSEIVVSFRAYMEARCEVASVGSHKP